jgi:hypothetical protein
MCLLCYVYSMWRDWELSVTFTRTLLTWRIWWASNNASRWQMGFNSAFKGLYTCVVGLVCELCSCILSFKNLKTNKKSGAVLQNTDFGISHLGSLTSYIMFIVHCYKSRHRIAPCLQAEPQAQFVIMVKAVLSLWATHVTSASRGRLKCDGTRAETRFRLSAKWTSPFKWAGASVQSTAGSRGVRISGSNAGYTMFRGSVKGTGYPLHSPVSPFTSPPMRHCVPSHVT